MRLGFAVLQGVESLGTMAAGKSRAGRGAEALRAAKALRHCRQSGTTPYSTSCLTAIVQLPEGDLDVLICSRDGGGCARRELGEIHGLWAAPLGTRTVFRLRRKPLLISFEHDQDLGSSLTVGAGS